ncbi:MAG: hypothetical protein LLG97_18220 [Deltaproteobacteria bacterium]|nr:hypothetical protein [Deltaproteobacteria bacterium]
MKPTQTIKIMDRKQTPWQKAAALPRRLWVLLGAAALILAAAWFLWTPGPGNAPRTPPLAAVETGAFPDAPAPAFALLPETPAPDAEPAFIQAVRLQPDRPTRADRLQAEVVPAPAAPKKLAYAYRWKVNDRIVPEAVGDSLILASFKRGDVIAVAVTPNDGTTDGFTVESPLVAVHATAPSLELKARRQVRKPGQPVELELVGVSPEGGPVSFSLEPPLVPGMTIDRASGKITWTLQPDQKGPFHFGAAVADSHGTIVTKTFDITAE